MAEQLYNPFGPPAYNGLNPDAPAGYTDVDFTYTYDVVLTGDQVLPGQQVSTTTDVDFTYTYDVVLTASQVLPGQQVSTTTDADFAIRAIVVATSTGSFSIKFYDSQNYALSNDYVASSNILGDASSPFPVFPEVLIPAGGRIGIDIEDTSGDDNTIEILFRGVKRYRLAPQ
jgi:hypothetical protein